MKFGSGLAPSNTLRWNKGLDAEDGTGVRVALLDSGVNWSHVTFANTRIRGRDFTGTGCLCDPTCHGSANAALLVGQSRDGAEGISPGCELLVAKVLGRREWKRTVVAITAALRWAVHSGCDIVVMPFGTSRGDAGMAHQIRVAVARGCQVFAAAGNHGPEQICFPAYLPEVTAVSALALDGSIYPRCCARDEVDLYCWGDCVPAVGLDESIKLSGSSPATVLAAGYAALLRAAERNTPTTKHTDMREKHGGLV